MKESSSLLPQSHYEVAFGSGDILKRCDCSDRQYFSIVGVELPDSYCCRYDRSPYQQRSRSHTDESQAISLEWKIYGFLLGLVQSGIDSQEMSCDGANSGFGSFLSILLIMYPVLLPSSILFHFQLLLRNMDKSPLNNQTCHIFIIKEFRYSTHYLGWLTLGELNLAFEALFFLSQTWNELRPIKSWKEIAHEKRNF